MAKVSIIVPVHNTEKYLRACVNSILAQTFKDIEIILVENASTDNSLAICRELSAQDERIRTISLDLGDLSNARNEGVKIARGDFIGFVDSDDTIDPEMYGRLYDAAIRNNADTVCCNYLRVYPDKPSCQRFPDDGQEKVMTEKEALDAIFNKKMPASACVFLIRKYIAEKNPFPVGRSMEDRATTYKYCAAASRSVYLRQSLYFYHQYRGCIINNTRTFKHSHDMEMAERDILSFIHDCGMFTGQSKRHAAKKTARSLVKQLNRMRRAISTNEEEAIYQESKQDLLLIPEGSMKHPLMALLRFFMMHSIGNF